jgi:predicted membrane metal-binding protein
LLHLLAGVGLLNMQNWGRLLTLLLSALALVILLPVLIAAHGLPLIFGAINAIAIFYLAMPPIKRAFHGERPALRAAV